MARFISGEFPIMRNLCFILCTSSIFIQSSFRKTDKSTYFCPIAEILADYFVKLFAYGSRIIEELIYTFFKKNLSLFLTSDHHQVDGCPYLLKMNLIMCNRFFGLIGAAIVICMTGNPLHAQVFLDEYSSPDGITYLLDRDANTAQVKGLTNVSDIVNIPQGITVNDTTYTVVSIDIIDGENLDNVTQVNLPASLQFFGQGNASLFPNLQKLYSWAVIPPFVSGDKSEHVLYVPDEETPSCTLYVPSVSLDYYRADSCWQSFAA